MVAQQFGTAWDSAIRKAASSDEFITLVESLKQEGEKVEWRNEEYPPPPLHIHNV